MKRRLILIISGLILVAAVVLLIVLRPAPGDTYRYQGKTVRQWLEQIFTTNQTATLDAFRHMGTNAYPGIVREFKRHDPWWTSLHWQLYPRFPDWLKYRWPRPISQQNTWNAAGLVLLNCRYGDTWWEFSDLVTMLGDVRSETRPYLFVPVFNMADPHDRDSLPALTALLHADDPDTRTMAALLLWKIDHRTNAAVTALRAAMNSRMHSYMKDYAPNYLIAINPHDESLIPVFIANLSSTNYGLRINAVNALGQFGPAASNAIPVLTKLLNSPDRYLHRNALESLKSIDSPNAAKYDQPPQ